MRKKFPNFLLAALLLVAASITAQESAQTLTKQLTEMVEQTDLLPEDIQWQITSEHTSSTSGIHHIYYRQIFNGLPVYGTESGLHVQATGKVISHNNRFVKNTSEKLFGPVNAALTPAQAVSAAALQLDYKITSPLKMLSQAKGRQEFLLSDGGISRRDIPVQLMYSVDAQGRLVLSYDLSIQSVAEADWWSVRVDATTGQIINRANWVSSCNLDHDHSDHTPQFDYNANLFDIPNYQERVANTPANCTECYEVFALPLESPYFGPRTIEVQPADPVASPYGWHDTNGVVGAEYTVTRGNNANAYEDGNNSGYQPNGGSNLDFSGFPFDQNYTFNNQYEDAAITNLFYINNIFHDILFQYGFDEASGNFQEMNYSGAGLGSDSVNAEAQDGSGTCNANFGTPPDGQNPTMQMYICGNKDGDYDTMVILHEYGHGVSNRLTGGPAASGCLQNTEQMGEGWSDFFGTILTITPGDTGVEARAVGNYLFGYGPQGGGIRDYPYSTDMSVNPQTYDFIKTAAVPHGVGSVWAQMLWEMTWGLIDEHGIDANPYNFTGDVNVDKGNTQAMALVIEGMKLQPCSPGFVDGRDAILAADIAIYGGANQCIIWDAFAKRGLGYSASQGSSSSRSDGTQAFDTPSQAATLSVLEEVCASSDVLTGLTGGQPFGGTYSGTGVTDDGNGSTFTFDPAVAGVGVHTITYSVEAGPCSAASNASDTIEVLSVPDGPATVGVSDFCVGEPVTVTATLNDPNNVIRWFDSPTGGTFLFEGTSYTFNPSGTSTVYAEEGAPGPVSKLVISEFNVETPDRFEIQNVGAAADYTGYKVAVSDQPYSNINSKNAIVKTLGAMDANSVVDFNDDGGAGYWGSNIWWGRDGTGWIVIIDPAGNVVDSVFWNFTANQIATFNVSIGSFTITAAQLDWVGAGASISANCGNDSFRRHGDTDSAADWPGTCEASDFGIPNADIAIGPEGCAGARTPTEVVAENEAPIIVCPEDRTVSVNVGQQYTLPNFSGETTVTDNCNAAPALAQSPVAGTLVGVGDTTVTMTATDAAGNAVSCEFTVTVDNIIGIEEQLFSNNILLYPNPTYGTLTLANRTSQKLESAIITDVKGRIIKTIDLTRSGSETQISVENLATGDRKSVV